MSTLTDRIVTLLRTEAASEALAGILDEARDELVDVNDACGDAKARMLDPSSSSAIVAKARKELEDLTLQASRLEAAIDRLADQLAAARAREAEATRVKLYNEAKAERDRLAKEILETYTELAAKIVGMLKQIGPVDEKVAAANRDLPTGAPYLDAVAHMTQIYGGWNLATSVRLPSLASVGIPDVVRTRPGQVALWPVG
jgi:hypothetical protein